MKDANSSKPRAQRGVTMIEVLVALLVFSFGILGVVGMHARAIQMSVDSEDRSRAALMANEIVSEMWTQGTAELPAAAIDAWQERVKTVAVSGLPGATGDVSAPDADGVVTVTITWKPPYAAVGAPDSVYETRVSIP